MTHDLHSAVLACFDFQTIIASPTRLDLFRLGVIMNVKQQKQYIASVCSYTFVAQLASHMHSRDLSHEQLWYADGRC